MSYCTVADVEVDFKGVDFTASSLITTATVTQFIVEADALINSYTGARWTVPITADASSLALMSLFSRTLVAARVRGILSNKQATNADANQNVREDALTVGSVMKALADIRDGKMQLSGASLLLANAGFKSYNQSQGIQPRFKKDTKQW